ncbi:MAG: hypothetical protein ACU0BS_09610 [Hasllibacter sp.]
MTARPPHGIGHNRGPEMTGLTYRTHLWRKARLATVPVLPLAVIRMRVRRAAELGLDYRTYDSIRAQSGRDVVAFLYSSNALRATPAAPAMPRSRAALLAAQKATRGALVHRPLSAPAVARANPQLDHADPAPRFTDSWSEMREGLEATLKARALSRRATVLVGETAFEAEWAASARLAGYLPASRVFGPA